MAAGGGGVLSHMQQQQQQAQPQKTALHARPLANGPPGYPIERWWGKSRHLVTPGSDRDRDRGSRRGVPGVLDALASADGAPCAFAAMSGTLRKPVGGGGGKAPHTYQAQQKRGGGQGVGGGGHLSKTFPRMALRAGGVDDRGGGGKDILHSTVTELMGLRPGSPATKTLRQKAEDQRWMAAIDGQLAERLGASLDLLDRRTPAEQCRPGSQHQQQPQPHPSRKYRASSSHSLDPPPAPPSAQHSPPGSPFNTAGGSAAAPPHVDGPPATTTYASLRSSSITTPGMVTAVASPNTALGDASPQHRIVSMMDVLGGAPGVGGEQERAHDGAAASTLTSTLPGIGARGGSGGGHRVGGGVAAEAGMPCSGGASPTAAKPPSRLPGIHAGSHADGGEDTPALAVPSVLLASGSDQGPAASATPSPLSARGNVRSLDPDVVKVGGADADDERDSILLGPDDPLRLTSPMSTYSPPATAMSMARSQATAPPGTPARDGGAHETAARQAAAAADVEMLVGAQQLLEDEMEPLLAQMMVRRAPEAANIAFLWSRQLSVFDAVRQRAQVLDDCARNIEAKLIGELREMRYNYLLSLGTLEGCIRDGAQGVETELRNRKKMEAEHREEVSALRTGREVLEEETARVQTELQERVHMLEKQLSEQAKTHKAQAADMQLRVSEMEAETADLKTTAETKTQEVKQLRRKVASLTKRPQSHTGTQTSYDEDDSSCASSPRRGRNSGATRRGKGGGGAGGGGVGSGASAGGSSNKMLRPRGLSSTQGRKKSTTSVPPGLGQSPGSQRLSVSFRGAPTGLDASTVVRQSSETGSIPSR